MYIRRKVFSVSVDAETGEEKLFSVKERTFSESAEKKEDQK